MSTVSPRQVVAFALFLTLAAADTAQAQLRSLAAVRHLALESSPGAERETKKLLTHAFFKTTHGLLVQGLDSVPMEDRARFARCVVRTRLPKPRTVGLECYDAADTYVGTKRASNVDRLAFDMWSLILGGSPGALSLHWYRYIRVEAPRADQDFLSNLLRQTSGFRVIEQPEDVAEPERPYILRCQISSTTSYTTGLNSKSWLELLLLNVDGEPVRAIVGQARLIMFVTSTEQARRKSLENAVHNLSRARQEDEETYAPRQK